MRKRPVPTSEVFTALASSSLESKRSQPVSVWSQLDCILANASARAITGMSRWLPRMVAANLQLRWLPDGRTDLILGRVSSLRMGELESPHARRPIEPPNSMSASVADRTACTAATLPAEPCLR